MNPIELLTEQLNRAHCDIDTGKIYGCKKHSLEWWHEKGHIEYSKRQETSALQVWQGIVFLIWMFSTTFVFLNKFMLWISIPAMVFYIWIDIYEEYWCNKYAKLNYRGVQNRSKKSSVTGQSKQKRKRKSSERF